MRRPWSNFKDSHHNLICGMEPSGADCGIFVSVHLLMDVGLGCDEGGGKCSEEQIGEAQNCLGWERT